MPSSRNSPGLRKRQLTPDSSDEKAALHSPSSAGVAKHTTAGRYLLILVSLSISAFVFWRSSPSVSATPGTYALCSPDGDNIYTVDDSTPRVQCLVVRDDSFVDTGSLGHLPTSLRLFRLSNHVLQMTFKTAGAGRKGPTHLRYPCGLSSLVRL